MPDGLTAEQQQEFEHGYRIGFLESRMNSVRDQILLILRASGTEIPFWVDMMLYTCRDPTEMEKYYNCVAEGTSYRDLFLPGK